MSHAGFQHTISVLRWGENWGSGCVIEHYNECIKAALINNLILPMDQMTMCECERGSVIVMNPLIISIPSVYGAFLASFILLCSV